MRRGWKIYFFLNVILFFVNIIPYGLNGGYTAHPIIIGKLILLSLMDCFALYSYAFRKHNLNVRYWKLMFWIIVLANISAIVYRIFPIPQLAPFFDLGLEMSTTMLVLSIVLTMPLFLPDIYVLYQLAFRNKKAFEVHVETEQEKKVPHAISAIISGLLGAFGFIFGPLTGIPAIILGIIALFKIRKHHWRGKYWAWFGILASIFQILVIASLIYFYSKTLIPGNNKQSVEEVLQQMTQEERDYYDKKLSLIHNESTPDSVKELLGAPKSISTVIFTRYVYDCPKPSAECSIIIDFTGGKAYQIGIIDSKRFSYVFQLKDKKSDITQLAADDPRILEAKKQAQESIKTLVEQVNSKDCYKLLDCKVKYDFVADDKHEHMWVAVLAERDGLLYGSLANVPEVITSLHSGDKVKVKVSDVEDWTIYDTQLDTLQGAYSIKALSLEDQIDQFKHPEDRDNYSNYVQQLQKTLDKIHADEGWDMSKKMVWEFVLSDKDKKKLETAAKLVTKEGFASGKVVEQVDEKEKDKIHYFLVIQESKVYSALSLSDRIADVITFSLINDIESFDSWNVNNK